MDVLSESLNEKIREIEAKIQKVIYIQEFDKAKEFEEKFQHVQEQIKTMRQAENQTHLYYYNAMNALDIIDFDIDDYMQNEGKIKEQKLNRTIFAGKLKQLIDDIKGKSAEQILADLKSLVQEIRELELATDLFSESYRVMAKVLLSIFMRQAQNNELIDLGLVEEITTKEAFAKEMQNQLATMAEERKEDKVVAYDILKVHQEVNEQTIGNLNAWQILSGKKEVKIKQPEPKKELPVEEPQEKQLISLEPKKRTIVDKLRDVFRKKDGTTIYTFGKLNRETGQYENIRVESHRFPPKGKSFIKRCQRECIGLEINDVDIVEIATIGSNMPQLQSLNFGKNVHEIRRGKLGRYYSVLRNVKRVEFSDDVERLGDDSFANFMGMTDVEFGENIKEIGSNCFSNCNKLENVNLPNQLSEVREFVFIDCENLQNVKLPESLSRIGEFAFYRCENLQTINLPDELFEIGECAFCECGKLENIKLPENLSEIGRKAFYSLKNDRDSAIHIPSKIDLNKAFEAFEAFGKRVYLESNGEIFEIKDRMDQILKKARKEYENKKEEDRGESDPRID